MLGSALAVLLAAASSSAPAPGRIAFAGDRAAAILRPAVYSVRGDGRGRRPLGPPLGLVVPSCPAWSPDGERLALVAGTDLYVLSASGGKRRRVGHGGVFCPITWSPDSTRLAYISSRNEVQLLRADGRGPRSTVRRLGRVYGSVGWSPDGRRIAFPRATQYGQRLFIRDLRTGRETAVPFEGETDADPAWSPDGHSLAFTHNDGLAEGNSIVVLDFADGVRRTIGPYGHTPAWSPDGRSVAYPYYTDLYVARRDGRATRRVLKDSDELGEESPPSYITAAWSPDSRELAAVLQGELWAARIDGRRRRRLSHERPAGRVVDYPAWGRDGRLAYLSKRFDPADRDIYTIDEDGSHLRTVTANDVDEDHPTLSPRGNLIAFVRYRRFIHPDVFVIGVDGKGEKLIAAGGDSPAWSPDGTEVAFHRGGEIRAVDPATSRERVLRRDTAEEGLAWSPEGSRLAYASQDEYGADLFVAPLIGGMPVSAGLYGCARAPDWSPDGSLIVFSYTDECVDDDRGEALATVRPDGSALQDVPLNRHEHDVASNEPSWSPSGTRIVFARTFYDAVDHRLSRLLTVRPDGTGERIVYDGPGSAWSPDWGGTANP